MLETEPGTGQAVSPASRTVDAIQPVTIMQILPSLHAGATKASLSHRLVRVVGQLLACDRIVLHSPGEETSTSVVAQSGADSIMEMPGDTSSLDKVDPEVKRRTRRRGALSDMPSPSSMVARVSCVIARGCPSCDSTELCLTHPVDTSRAADRLTLSLRHGNSEIFSISCVRDLKRFSSRDYSILDSLRPHLVEAYRNEQKILNLEDRLGVLGRGLDLIDRKLLLAHSSGAVIFASPRSYTLLKKFFGGAAPSFEAGRRQLPATLHAWLGRSLGSAAASSLPLVVKRQNEELVISLVQRIGDDQALLVLTRRAVQDISEHAARSDLPPKLAMVLDLLVQGLSEKQIAAELALSRHTVHDYVQGIYKRRQVSSRAELLARVLSP